MRIRNALHLYPRALPVDSVRWLALAVLSWATMLQAGCQESRSAADKLSGRTMGTQYQVITACGTTATEHVRAISDTLEAVDAQMSTYRSDSLLSQINDAPTGEWLDASAELLDVLEPALELSRLSDGAFDVTVGPLVNLWGFGPADTADAVPDAAAVAAALENVGFQYLELRRPGAVRKQRELFIDLSAIAKGYAVDRLAELLLSESCPNFLVEIGGEVRIAGHKRDGSAWRIGIETPDAAAIGGVHRVIEDDGIAMATSGDYRNFIEHAGRHYSHTIDPRTGAPVSHRLASVTVLHTSTLWADGFATLLNVMGPNDGFALAEREQLAALFIERTDAGFVERATQAFANRTSN